MPQRKNTIKPKVVHAYIAGDAIHACTKNIQKVKSGVSLRCARSILVHTSHYSRLEKPTIYSYRLPPNIDYHVYIALSNYPYAYARQTQINWQKETKKRKGDEGKYIYSVRVKIYYRTCSRLTTRRPGRPANFYHGGDFDFPETPPQENAL